MESKQGRKEERRKKEANLSGKKKGRKNWRRRAPPPAAGQTKQTSLKIVDFRFWPSPAAVASSTSRRSYQLFVPFSLPGEHAK